MKLISRHGWVALPLIVLAALCFLDQSMNAVDVIRPSWLLVTVLSCPLGWLAHWLARWLTEMLLAPGQGAFVFLFVFVASAVGTVLNIYFIAMCIVQFFSQPSVTAHNSSEKIGSEEFQRLLAEHRTRKG